MNVYASRGYRWIYYRFYSSKTNSEDTCDKVQLDKPPPLDCWHWTIHLLLTTVGWPSFMRGYRPDRYKAWLTREWTGGPVNLNRSELWVKRRLYGHGPDGKCPLLPSTATRDTGREPFLPQTRTWQFLIGSVIWRGGKNPFNKALVLSPKYSTSVQQGKPIHCE